MFFEHVERAPCSPHRETKLRRTATSSSLLRPRPLAARREKLRISAVESATTRSLLYAHTSSRRFERAPIRSTRAGLAWARGAGDSRQHRGGAVRAACAD